LGHGGRPSYKEKGGIPTDSYQGVRMVHLRFRTLKKSSLSINKSQKKVEYGHLTSKNEEMLTIRQKKLGCSYGGGGRNKEKGDK